MQSGREFDIVVLGPTGYTGKLCAEHIVKHLPTNLKWALAGRSPQKIEGVAEGLKKLNPDRTKPEILTVQLNITELKSLAERTKVLINAVGPYHLYSTPVVEACALTGTHYLDATGETPWVKQTIEKYHETAKSSGAIIIHCVGVESAPADMLAWVVVKEVREKLSCHTREVTGTIYDFKSSGASGGTLSTILLCIENFSKAHLLASTQPFSLAASTPTPTIPSEPIMARVLGVRAIRGLGTLTKSPTDFCDITTVHRSSTLMREFYGPRFYFRQFLRVRNAFTGILFNFAFLLGTSFLLLAPVRWLVKKIIYAPGSGPTEESGRNDRCEYRAIATPDKYTDKRVLGKMKFEGSMYLFTGLLLAEAAMVIVENEEKVKKVSRCGIVTSAVLGQDYIDRLEKVGCTVETEVLEN
ncbi:Saccharopine dehydrogenase-domain-containing protein [Aspergillus pseudoustus]|uniref:Saccharopine dehydrogenase-domain-containing protein n=1 Tax=Aspergillus pseudoustus TaxID=1810923 RepID=A0ABR4KH45_9EURO